MADKTKKTFWEWIVDVPLERHDETHEYLVELMADFIEANGNAAAFKEFYNRERVRFINEANKVRKAFLDEHEAVMKRTGVDKIIAAQDRAAEKRAKGEK